MRTRIGRLRRARNDNRRPDNDNRGGLRVANDNIRDAVRQRGTQGRTSGS